MAVKKEYKGADIKEAIDNACADLALSSDNLDVEVISTGSAGLFGLFRKPALIKAAEKSLPSHSRGGMRNNPVPAPPAGATAEIGRILQQILNLLDCNAEVEIKLGSNNHINAHISTNDEQGIIGRDGENIDAIQYLLRKIISHTYPGKIFFSLDVGNYRASRRKQLESLALAAADKARASGKSQIIGALNPAERRIIHVTLQDDRLIRSASIGNGLFKKIKIYVHRKARDQK